MAVRYFDLNGSTAGFGTLTGAWDTSSAFWSTSSAGTAVPTAYTFTNVDTAQFGFAGTTGTAGTATIAAALNVTLNSIVTANLAGLQTIAGGAGSTLTLAGTAPSVVVGSAGGLTISAVVAGTDGLAKSGTGILTLSGANTFTGAFSGTAGQVIATTATAIGAAASTAGISSTGGHILNFSGTAPTYSGRDVTLGGTPATGALRFSFTNGTATFKSIMLTANATIAAIPTSTTTLTTGATAIALGANTLTLVGSGTNAATFAIPSQISGLGGVAITAGISTAIITLSATNSDYTGPTTVTQGILRVASLANIGIASSIGAPAIGSATITLGLSGTTPASLDYAGTANVSTNRPIDLASTTAQITLSTTSTGNVTYTANLTATGSGAKTLALSGSSTGSVTLAGVVPDSAGGATSIAVSGASATHYLSGTANTYTGTTTVASGTLQFNSIGNVGAGPSSLGNPALANATIRLNGGTSTIRYLGTGAASSNRVIDITVSGTVTGVIEASGTGTLTLTSALASTGVGARTLILGGFTSGVFSGAITNAGGNVISLTKAGSGAWSIPASNAYTGNVSITGGPLTISAASGLGTGTKTVTISSPTYRNSSLVLAGTGDSLASTTTFPSMSSSGYDSFYFPQGAIKATSDWTVAGAITVSGKSALAADGGNLTLAGLVSTGANETTFRAGAGKTLYIIGGATTTGSWYTVGPGTVEWKANASNAAGNPRINGGTLRFVTDGTITNPFGSGFSGVSFGTSNASGTTSQGSVYSRYAYTGGVAEFANTGAAGTVTLTLGGTTSVARGVGTMRLNRASTAGQFSVLINTFTAPTTGLVYWEYTGTPGTTGISSQFALYLSNVPSTRVLASVISDGSALVPAYRNASRVVVPMVYDGTQATVLATQAGGSSLTGASATTNHNISANITAQPSVAISSLRMEAGTALTLTGGSILEAALLMDMGTSAATILSGGRLARSRSQSAELTTTGLQFYTANTAGATIASDIDVPFGTNFAKVGPGLVTHTGAISKLATYALAEGDATFSSAGSFNGEYTQIVLATPATTTNTLTLGTTGTISVGSLSGGGANTTLALTGGDLKLTASSNGQIYSGNITRSASQKLILRSIVGTPNVLNSYVLSGSVDVASIDVQRGGLIFLIESGASLASAIPVNFTGVGLITIGALSTTLAPIGADYNLAFGPITVTQGSGRITLASVTATTNFYATRVSTSAVPTVAADGALDFPTANALTSFTVTGASVGPMGINLFAGSSRAYYRAAGSTLASGQTTPVGTVDIPNYGSDANFPAAKVAGVAFTVSAATDNVYVSGAQSAQTSVTVASLRSAATITMASASDRITTDLFIAGSATPIVGGELATNTGRLYVYTGTNAAISSAIVNNGATLTRLVLTGSSGTLTLSGTNTFSGGLALLGSGSVAIASDANLGTGTIDSYGGDLNLSSAGSNTITRDITVYDGGLYLTGSTAGVKLSGIISGTGDVFVAGSGLTLQGANDNSGTLRLVGTYLADATSLSNFAGIDFQTGGNFRVTSLSTPDISSLITPRPAGTVTLTNVSGGDYTLASSFGNGSTFTKTSVTGVVADRVILAAENYFNAATLGANNGSAAVGATRAAATNALGWGTVTLTTGDPTVTGQGAALELSNNITLPNAFTLSGKGLSGLGAIRSLGGSNTLSGAIATTANAGLTTRIGADIGSTLTMSGGITSNATGRIIEFVGAGTTTESGVIGSTTFIAVARPAGADAGVTRLLAANTYSAGTDLVEGTIFAGNEAALGTGNVSMASGTTLQSGTAGGQNGKLTVTGTLTNNGGTIRIGG